MITDKKGNIFTTKCQTIVNTVNCVGVMGAGIAYEFRLRFPDMFKKYKERCDNSQINIGKLWNYVIEENHTGKYEYILNFPTKNDWKNPSKIEYLEKGLKSFSEIYQKENIKSIAFPLLGADRGGLSKESSKEIMKKYLEKLDIDIEIWHFDPTAKDDLYENLKEVFLALDVKIIEEKSGLKKNFISTIQKTLSEEKSINSLSGLLRVKGIGAVSLEKLFEFSRRKDLKDILKQPVFSQKNQRSLF
jgi:O-acetyl-ADP-ribose deacetylase (regulator of RNase III)